MTPREGVFRVLNGMRASKVPFTMFKGLVPQCVTERILRNRGLCLVVNTGEVNVFKTHTPNVRVSQQIYREAERKLLRTKYETPVGDLYTLQEISSGYTYWHLEKMFKTPDDYRAIEFLIRDEVYERDYASFADARHYYGDDLIFRLNFGREPLQTLISCEYMDMQTFCVEWMDNRDEILRLYQAILEKRREVYPIIAQSPAQIANYGGNVTPDIVGVEVFEKYYVPHYNEAAEIMHRHGKLIGCHFDANCRLLSQAIASTKLDYIEAFTPAPDTDMTLAEARAAWPDKVLWLNFPSSVHLRPPDEIERFTVDLLNELNSIDGMIMGVTEDIPREHWQASCTAIMDGLDRHAREYPSLYTGPSAD